MLLSRCVGVTKQVCECYYAGVWLTLSMPVVVTEQACVFLLSRLLLFLYQVRDSAFSRYKM